MLNHCEMSKLTSGSDMKITKIQNFLNFISSPYLGKHTHTHTSQYIKGTANKWVG